MADSPVNTAFHGSSLYYSNILQKDSFSEDEAESVLWEIANENWGGNKYNQLRWLAQKALGRKKTNDWRIRIRCHYYQSCGCKWICEQIGSYENGVVFRVGNIDHIDHHLTNKKVGAFSQALVLIKNPGCLNQTPAQFVSCVRTTGITVSIPQEKAIKRKFSRLRTLSKTGHMDKGTKITSFAAVDINLDRLKKENIEQFDFHTIYLLRSSYVLDMNSSPPRILALLSSENLLLNAYRQMQYGSSIKIYIDASYRYTVEGWGVLIVKVNSMDGKGHTVAYAMCSREDSAAHHWIFSTLKAEVERLVNELIKKKIDAIAITCI